MAFVPLQAAVGGLFIGCASGLYMLFARRVAGNSGALKALVLGPRDPSKLSYLAGLVGGGALMAAALPSAFEASPPSTPLVALAGLAVGCGTALGNGCTSGHGLSGLSRLSKRSLVAVPTFMAVAIVTATLRNGTRGPIVPVAAAEPAVLALAAQIGGGLAVALLPLAVLSRADRTLKEAYAALWTGTCFAVGLAIGGMTRPSAVVGALSPARFDGTLWVLFMTALAVTFSLYRLAGRLGVAEASAFSDTAAPQAVDLRLIVGAALFGTGWGLIGVCPGPHLVGLGAAPFAPGLWLLLLNVALGMRLAAPAWAALCPSRLASRARPDAVSTVDEVRSAVARPGATTVDLRPLVPSEMREGGFTRAAHAISAVWDTESHTMSLAALPADRSSPLILYCRTGRRAGLAKAFLEAHSYSHVLNAGGVDTHAPTTLAALGQPLHRHELGVLVQLFDGLAPGGGSSTYTYILGDTASKECIIIDPVLEQVDRDLKAIDALGLTPTLAVNTHCHADHITGTGAMKRRLAGLSSLISKASGAKADRHLKPGEAVRWAGGRRTLAALATPGHTPGCMSFFDDSIGCVFTGDALLIGSCGRTDFQQGNPEVLYDSVHAKLFSLPETTLVLPAHDYKGRAYSTIAAEKSSNPRLSKSKAEFLEIMRNLELPYPKKIDTALPANLVCGL